MNMEKIILKINKLGLITNSVVEIKPMMVFSGESGLGKSYLAMLCHYFFDVLLDSLRMNRFFSANPAWSYRENKESYKGRGLTISVNKGELQKWLAEDAIQYLRYMLNDDSFKADIEVVLPETIDDVIQYEFEESINSIEGSNEPTILLSALGLSYRVQEETLFDESPYSVLMRYGLINRLFGSFKNLSKSYVFPPSRGPVLTEEIIPKTGLYDKFKNGLLQINRIPPHSEEVDIQLINLFKTILDGSVAYKDGKYFYDTLGDTIPISSAAASVREIAPIAMLVDRNAVDKSAILIEEPEAHLHPIKQRMMADIVCLLNKYGAYLQITTHSDYFIRRMNELIKLDILYRKNLDNYKVVCQKLGVSPDLHFDGSNLTAYLLIRRGDGSSEAIKQDSSNSIPFASFTSAIDDSLSNRYIIDKYLNE